MKNGSMTLHMGEICQGAITAIGSNPTVLHIPPGTWPIASDLTIPANITLKLPRGAILNIANGKTLTLNGGVDAGLYQIFSWAGTGKVVFGMGSVDRIIPQWWGAKGDNSSDDTVAIEAAWKACWVTPPQSYFMNYQNPVLYFPPGNYTYNGTGLIQQYTYANITVKGEGPGSTCIRTNNAYYFIDVDYCDSVRISGINFRGGKGAFRQNGTAANVGGECIFENNWFYEYTECAVGFNTADKADIKIKNNFFYGNRVFNTIGIALSYTPDNSDITGNCFVCDKYHIKVPGAGMGGVFIARNEFIRWNSPDPTYDVWIIPGATINPGNVNIYSNKFGNEQLHDNDVRILIADEDAGTYNSDKHHAVTASTGIVNGMKIRDNAFFTT